MQPLTSDLLDAFLHRFHHGRDGRLQSMAVEYARGGVSAVTFTLTLRDAEHDDADLALHLQIAAVMEMRLQVRPTEDVQTLEDGIHIESFQGQFFVDLLPWTDRPSGVHDYRVSSCYAAGAILRWGTVTE